MNRALFVSSFATGACLPFSKVRRREGGSAGRDRQLLALGVAGVSSFFFLGSRMEYINILRNQRIRTLSAGNLCYLLGASAAGVLAGLASKAVLGTVKPIMPRAWLQLA